MVPRLGREQFASHTRVKVAVGNSLRGKRRVHENQLDGLNATLRRILVIVQRWIYAERYIENQYSNCLGPVTALHAEIVWRPSVGAIDHPSL